MQDKVLLVNAPAEHVKEKHYEQPDMPRIGLAYLGAYLLNFGIDCNVIDAKYERLAADNISKFVHMNKPNVVGFTAMTTEIIDTARLATRIKKEHPDIVTVIGGPHVSALPKETLEEFPDFDIACIGEGEYTLKELIERVREKTSLENIEGIAYRKKNGDIRVNEQRSFIKSLDEIPFPAWYLFSPAKKYPILGSRGCPFRCNFCMRVLGGYIRYRDPDLVIKEMAEVYDKYKPRLFEFYDETFGVNKDKTNRLLDSIIDSGLNKKIKWHIQTRVDVVNQELLSKMKKASCEWVGFGVESGNDEILKKTNKNITKQKAMNAIQMAKNAKLSTGSFFILGHPHETKETIKDTINFALTLNTTTVSFGIMTPYPGTEIAKMAEEGSGGYRLLSKNWSDYNKQTSDVLELEGVTREMLQRYQLAAYLKFYFLRFKISKIKSLLSFVDLKSLLKILAARVFKVKRR